jgi:mycoredoxin
MDSWQPSLEGRHSLDVRTDSPMITMYSTTWCGYCHRLTSQLDREGIPYTVVDIEKNEDAAFIVEQVNGGNQTVPTLVYADGSAHTNPSVAQVKAKLASLN